MLTSAANQFSNLFTSNFVEIVLYLKYAIFFFFHLLRYVSSYNQMHYAACLLRACAFCITLQSINRTMHMITF